MEAVLHFIMIGSAFVFPIIVVSELQPTIFRAVAPLDVKGSISLPLAYSVWSVSYLLSWFRGYIRPLAATDGSHRDFSARFGLSPRESDVVRLLLGGQSYKEIMASLSITMPTVKTHVGSIYRKTSCNKCSSAYSSRPPFIQKDRRGRRSSHTNRRWLPATPSDTFLPGNGGRNLIESTIRRLCGRRLSDCF